MPLQTRYTSVLVLGTGSSSGEDSAAAEPSVAQACRALRAEGLRVILVCCGTATVLAEPQLADLTYLEPVTPETITAIIDRERPNALLVTTAGGVALQTVVALCSSGVLKKYNVDLIGADVDYISGRRTRLDGAYQHYELAYLRDRSGSTATLASSELVAWPNPVDHERLAVMPPMSLDANGWERLRQAGAAMVAAMPSGTVGCAVTFTVDPVDGQILASTLTPWPSGHWEWMARASGIPLGHLTARLALGDPLDQLWAEPAADPGCVAVHLSRGPVAGQAMGLGGNVAEALQKALRCFDRHDIHAWWSEPGAVPVPDWLGMAIGQIRSAAGEIAQSTGLGARILRHAKRFGFSDAQLAHLTGISESAIRRERHWLDIRPSFACLPGQTGGEYRYSTYHGRPATVAGGDGHPVIVVAPAAGRPPGEHDDDFICAQTAAGLRDAGHHPVMICGDPAALCTVADVDRLYLEPSTMEDVLAICDAEQATRPVKGVLVPADDELAAALAPQLSARGIPAMTRPATIVGEAADNSTTTTIAVEALFDGEELYIGGLLERVDADTICYTPLTVSSRTAQQLSENVRHVAAALEARGLFTAVFAFSDDEPQLVRARTGASSDVPFLSAVTGLPLAGAAARICLGESISKLRAEGMLSRAPDGGCATAEWIAVRTSAHRTGMGIDSYFGAAFAKAYAGAHTALPTKGKVLVSVANQHQRPAMLPLIMLADMGFDLLATPDTALMLARNGITAEIVAEVVDRRSAATEHILRGQIDLAIAIADPSERYLAVSAAAWATNIACVDGCRTLDSVVHAIDALSNRRLSLLPLPRPVLGVCQGEAHG
ncbi:MAG TPA: hypothetical protein VFC19_27360 [Candidatus Limnocylindrales bacterium]|nr:hypothetical protein [Candidatus Limnocylindrales bacterium]